MRILSLTVVFLIFYGATAHAQKTTIKLKEGTASRLIGDMKDGQRITRFIKSELQLAFIQNTTTIYCDSAWLFRDKNAIEAFGNVKIVEGDSITITSRHLEYDGNTKKAKLRNNVVFTKLATAKLYTDFWIMTG